MAGLLGGGCPVPWEGGPAGSLGIAPTPKRLTSLSLVVGGVGAVKESVAQEGAFQMSPGRRAGVIQLEQGERGSQEDHSSGV